MPRVRSQIEIRKVVKMKMPIFLEQMANLLLIGLLLAFSYGYGYKAAKEEEEQ